jgi:iron complex outermembrane receptor protein
MTTQTHRSGTLQSGSFTPLSRALQLALLGFAAGAAHAQDTSGVTLPPVTVKPAAETATGPVTGYVARQSATATKTDTPLIESPQSITVVGAEQIVMQKAQSLTEALGYSAGVFRSEDVDSTRDQMRVRGFDLDAEYGSYYRDGLKYTVNGFNGQQELYGLERVELLRGAASLLYGVSAPGGLVNTVSKRPTADTLRELNVEFGSFDRKQVSGDFAGAFVPSGDWTYRLTALVRDSETFVDHIGNDRVFVAPAFKWQPNAATSLTVLTEYQEDKSAYSSGLPAKGTLQTNPNGQLPRDRFLGTPGFDKWDNTRYSVGYLFEHTFNESLKLRNSARYFHNENDYASTGVGATLAADNRTVSRSASYRFDESKAGTADLSLQYQVKHDVFEHTVLAGLDYTRTSHKSERYSGAATAIDIYNPDVNNRVGPFAPQLSSSWTGNQRAGLYLQDQVKIAGRWVVSAGLRQDWLQVDQCRVFTGVCPAHDEKSDALTGRIGAVYLVGNGLAPFLSYSTSWEPVNGTSANGSRFKPTEGEQVEAGVRYQPTGWDASFSATVYQLERTNVLANDPNNNLAAVQIGDQVSRGLELEAQARIGRNTNVIAAYAYTDATTKRNGIAPAYTIQDERTGGVPYNQFSVWADHTFGDFGLPGLKAGAGLRYVGGTIGLFRLGNDFLETPSYTLVDLMGSYTTGPWRFALNVTNVGDRDYLAACPFRCYYGEPRKAIASATYRW